MKTKEGQRRGGGAGLQKARADHVQLTVPSAAAVCWRTALQRTADGSELQPSACCWAPALDSGQGVRRCGWRTSSNFSSRGALCITAALDTRDSVHRRGAVQGRDCRHGRQRRIQRSSSLAPAPPGRLCRASPASPSCQREPLRYQACLLPSARRMRRRHRCV